MKHLLLIIFYNPLYNGLVELIHILPGNSAGLAIIVMTLIIRAILFPLSKQSIKTQLQMKSIEGEVEDLKKNVKDKQEQSRQLMQLYKDRGINPFAGLLLVIIQLPILIGLYEVFRSGLPHIDAASLYPFIHMPHFVSMSLLGIDLTKNSLILAILAVITQFIQVNLSVPKAKKKTGDDKKFSSDLAYSMNMQMRYIVPLIMFPIAYFYSAAIALYLVVSNIFTIFQELFVRRRMAAKFAMAKSLKAEEKKPTSN